MSFMEGHHMEYIGLALFVASEIVGINPKWRSNSLLQLLISAALRAFPYEPKRKPNPLDKLLGK